MQAYHNDPKIKDFYINRVLEHQRADEIMKGIYWHEGKGCAVGCTIHGNGHSTYEDKLGIPQILAYIEDKIFENLPNNLAKEWPLKFLESINVGADLSKVWPNFVIFLLEDESQCNSRHPQCSIVADAYRKHLAGKPVNWKTISNSAYVEADAAAWEAKAAAVADAAVAAAAAAAAWAAAAADAAAWDAKAAAAWDAKAVDAAIAAADKAAFNAPNAAAAADAAAWEALAAADAAAEAIYTEKKEFAFIKQAEKLLQLLNECE